MRVARKLLFERLELLDRVRNGLPVGEHAAQPAVVDEMLTRCACCISDWALCLALCANKQNLAARRNALGNEIKRTCEQWHGLRQIENVDAVARAEDIRLHTRVPTVCLVAEMGPSFKQLLHGYDRCRHGTSPSG